MTAIKSPFYIVQEFISPLLCEQIVDGLDFLEPETDDKDEPILSIKKNDRFENILFQALQHQMPDIEKYYDIQYRGTKSFEFKWYPEGCPGDPAVISDNSIYSEKKKWIKNRDRDLTGIIFLSDHNSEVPFESAYEVYGGKYEFPQHGFGFNAQRGTLIIYPSEPHFLNAVTTVYAGDLFLTKFHIATQLPFFYNPNDFPGDMTTWFEKII